MEYTLGADGDCLENQSFYGFFISLQTAPDYTLRLAESNTPREACRQTKNPRYNRSISHANVLVLMTS